MDVLLAGFDPARALSLQALFAASELAMVAPAAYLASLPVLDRLRISTRVYGCLVVVLVVLLCAAAPFLAGFDASSNTVLVPAVIVFFALYMCLVELPPARKASVFFTAAMFGAFITYAALLVDTFVGGRDAMTSTYLTQSGAAAQWVLWAAVVAVMVRPVRTKLPRILEGPLLNSRFWGIFWVLPLMVTLALIALVPEDVGTLLYRRVGFTAVVGVGSLFLLTLVVYALLVRLVRSTEKVLEARERETRLSMRLLMHEHLEERMESARRARHDLRQHDRVVMTFLEEDDLGGLRDYLSEHEAGLASTSPLRVCANAAVNAIVVYYWDAALRLGSQVDMALEVPGDLGGFEPDVVVVLGNLLENAVEALEGFGPGGMLDVRAHMRADALFITVDNSCATCPEVLSSGLLASTKHPGEGIGTQSVRAVAKSHDGTASFTCEDGVFSASVMLDRCG